MKHILVLLIFIIWMGDTPGRHVPDSFKPEIRIEDGVFMGGQLPQFGKLCQESKVYGGPDENIYSVIEILPVGEVVALHELATPDSSWVMIDPAKWIKFKNVCDW